MRRAARRAECVKERRRNEEKRGRLPLFVFLHAHPAFALALLLLLARTYVAVETDFLLLVVRD
jgi:hypothetical protein